MEHVALFVVHVFPNAVRNVAIYVKPIAVVLVEVAQVFVWAHVVIHVPKNVSKHARHHAIKHVMMDVSSPVKVNVSHVIKHVKTHVMTAQEIV